ncbi:HNH endonuclease signature motif containing protein [Leclercia sp.]|uniref:HNH endonuclease signature motif containing protein n=1 Tax=Leclercia sp. TaxID=1898428 RepID=UPI002FDEEB3F
MNDLSATPTRFTSIEELGLTGEILSICTNYADGKGVLELNLSTGTGMSGYWLIDQKRHFDHVVLRVKESDKTYKIYTGRFINLQSPEGKSKKIAVFDNLKFQGITNTNSQTFNGGKYSGHGRTYVTVLSSSEPQIDEPESDADAFPATFREGSERVIRTRPDQSPFAEAVRVNCYGRCVVTGATLRWRTEAAHIIPHSDRGIPDVSNGLLLRRDIHALFDQGHCAINPDTMMLHFSLSSLQQDSDLAEFHLTEITPEKLQKPVNKHFLLTHWQWFVQKQGEE